jgi:hypothetical protein
MTALPVSPSTSGVFLFLRGSRIGARGRAVIARGESRHKRAPRFALGLKYLRDSRGPYPAELPGARPISGEIRSPSHFQKLAIVCRFCRLSANPTSRCFAVSSGRTASGRPNGAMATIPSRQRADRGKRLRRIFGQALLASRSSSRRVPAATTACPRHRLVSTRLP